MPVARRPWSYSLLTMFVAVTLVGLVIALRSRAIFLMPISGVAMTYAGYGPWSSKRNPAAGFGFYCVGFVLRLAGMLLLLLTLLWLLFAFSMTRPAHIG